MATWVEIPAPADLVLGPDDKHVTNGPVATLKIAGSSTDATHADQNGNGQTTGSLIVRPDGMIGTVSARRYVQSGTSLDITVNGVTRRLEPFSAGELDAAGGGAITASAGRSSSLRNPALRDFVSAKDYGAQGNGSTDDTSNLLLGSDAARNAGKRFNVPSGKYKVSDSITTPGNPNPLILTGDGPGLTEFTMAAGMVLPVISVTGALGAGTALTAPTSIGAYLVDVASTAGITAGMYVRLIDTTQPIYGLSTRDAVSCASEWARVYSVVSSTRLRLHQRLEFAYTTSALCRPLTTAVKCDVRQCSIRNLTPGTLAATARGIQATYWADLRIRDVDFTDMDASCVTLQRGVHALVEGLHFLDTRDNENPANAPYGISASSCQDVLIEHIRSRYGRHLYTAGGDMTYGVASHIRVADVLAVEHSASGLDTHPGAIKHVFADCHVHAAFPTEIDLAGAYETSGYQIRGYDTDLINCSADGMPDRGAYYVYGADRGRIIGGRFNDCNIGVTIEDSDACFIGGDLLIQNPRTNGIVFDRNTPYAAYMTKATLGDLRITGNPSGAALLNNVSGLAIDYL